MAICRNIIIIFIISLAAMFSFLPAYAQPLSYSVQGWDESGTPVSEAKMPVPLELWEVPPLAILAVTFVLISPVFLLPAEIILAVSGMIALNFRRIDKKTILDNNSRNEIYQFIVKNPGTSFTEVENCLLVNRGTLDYHLRILKQKHIITAFSKNKRNFYFENSGRYQDLEMQIFVSLRNETNYSICKYLLDSPDASRSDIAEKVMASSSTVSWYMRRLSDAGIILSTKCGRVVRYRMSPSAAEVMDKVTVNCFSSLSDQLFSCHYLGSQYEKKGMGDNSD